MPSVPEITVAELKQKLAVNAVTVLDIRDPADFDAGHISGALAITNENLADFIEKTDKTQPLAVCCYRGNSSQAAVLYLKEIGFTDVASVAGGYAAWVGEI